MVQGKPEDFPDFIKFQYKIGCFTFLDPVPQWIVFAHVDSFFLCSTFSTYTVDFYMCRQFLFFQSRPVLLISFSFGLFSHAIHRKRIRLDILFLEPWRQERRHIGPVFSHWVLPPLFYHHILPPLFDHTYFFRFSFPGFNGITVAQLHHNNHLKIIMLRIPSHLT